MFIGEIIGGVGSLIGGYMNKESNEKIAAQNIAMQREFAQQGIRWKVADAKAAGIHPLYALGAQTNSFSNIVGDNSMGDAVSSASQNFGRAAQAAMTRNEREATNALTALQLEKAGLENDLLRTEIVGKKRAMLGPALPGLDGRGAALAGQGDAARAAAAVSLPKPGTPRNYELGAGPLLRANPKHSQQDDISKEYGDEGLPQLPGQIRFAVDYLKSIGAWPGDTWMDPNVTGSPAYIIKAMRDAERGALSDKQRRRNWRYRYR